MGNSGNYFRGLACCACSVASVVSNSLRRCGLQFLCPWDSPGENTGVGCHAILQRIFPTQGSSQCLLGLLPCQAGSLPLEPPGKPSTCHTQQRNWLRLWRRGARHLRRKSGGPGLPMGYSLHLMLQLLLLITNATAVLARAGPLPFSHL